MYGHNIYSGVYIYKAEYISTVKVASPARGQLNREKMNVSLSPFAPENLLVSRDGFGRPAPLQPTHSPYSGWIWCLLTGFLPISAAKMVQARSVNVTLMQLANH